MRTTLVLILPVTRKLMLKAPNVGPVLVSLEGALQLMIPKSFPVLVVPGTVGTLVLACPLLNV